LTVYLDTSVLAGFFIRADTFASRAKSFFAGIDEVPLVSDFVAAEFSSVIARLVRKRQFTAKEARETFALFDNWRTQSADDTDAVPDDIRLADTIIRRLDLNIRAPDAINLAIAMRLDAAVATFDSRMAENARTLGVAVAMT
jgi:predicted nucleic acid-binding protein